MVSVERFVVDKAIDFAWRYRLRSNDAVHLASAVLTRCDHFFSWNKKDFPMGEQVEGVRVSEPYVIGQQSIW
ncbi:putative nucleic acid-binding protein [Nocardiopsis mwathae]|uniref:Putative nucleic acid-binding protein n=2 Tax=Nocardiopsis mwathae TaxID=1472723 RepID=A0A7W9YL07_9ACTN|nr:putative nucleic acid-binding protein [Nocardiopsis mwathae]